MTWSIQLGHSNVLVAEAYGLGVSLQAALLHNHLKIKIEGDSKILIDCINKKIATRHGESKH